MKGDNAEDCAYCSAALQYPWICPGHTVEDTAAFDRVTPSSGNFLESDRLSDPDSGYRRERHFRREGVPVTNMHIELQSELETIIGQVSSNYGAERIGEPVLQEDHTSLIGLHEDAKSAAQKVLAALLPVMETKIRDEEWAAPRDVVEWIRMLHLAAYGDHSLA